MRSSHLSNALALLELRTRLNAEKAASRSDRIINEALREVIEYLNTPVPPPAPDPLTSLRLRVCELEKGRDEAVASLQQANEELDKTKRTWARVDGAIRSCVSSAGLDPAKSPEGVLAQLLNSHTAENRESTDQMRKATEEIKRLKGCVAELEELTKEPAPVAMTGTVVEVFYNTLGPRLPSKDVILPSGTHVTVYLEGGAAPGVDTPVKVIPVPADPRL